MSAPEDQARDVDFSVLVDIHIGADDVNILEHNQLQYTYTKTILYTATGRTSAVELRGTNTKNSLVVGYSRDRYMLAAWLTESGTQVRQLPHLTRPCWRMSELKQAIPELLRSYIDGGVLAFLNTPEHKD